MTSVDDILAHISEKPWSSYSEADYTLEQYASACLVSPPKAQLTSKSQCKLPVKTPNGALSRAGVHAAAGALAGARGGVQLTAEERASAKTKLRGYYSQLNEEPPPSLAHADLKGGTVANTTAAIMAIPAPLENIRLVGDEEKHATLLFFGETSTLPDNAKNILIESVKMACSMLFPFTERLREIARLGNDVPPALVAKLSDECLSQVRNLFMMNPAVNGYLSNGKQYPSFTPHVTLAYPDYAEEALIRTLVSQLYRVQFDRLAVWWNEERIEFPLSRIVEGDSMAMSDAVDEFLEHHGFLVEVDEEDAEQSGVKGMKWGVRRRVDPKTGLVQRTSSADQIHVDRIAKKLHSGGVSALSNKDLQDFSTRINREQEFNRALSSREAQRSKPFIQRFLATQGKRQFSRVTDKAIDVAVEKILEEAGIRIGKKGGNPDVADLLVKTGGRLKPKKGK